MSNVKCQMSKVIQWQPKNGYNLSYDLEKGDWQIFFQLTKDQPESLEVKVNLKEPWTHVKIIGLFYGQKDYKLPWNLTVHHQASETKADILIKGIMKDQAKNRFNGLLKIDLNCQNVESFLGHHTLSLSKEAEIEVIPSLEIESNQVRASHAATITRIDNQQIFYLQSRGIKTSQAEKLLIDGFLKEVKLKI